MLTLVRVLAALIVLLAIINWIIAYCVFRTLWALGRERTGVRQLDRNPSLRDFIEGWQRADEFNGKPIMILWTVSLILLLLSLLSCSGVLIYLAMQS